MQAGALAPADIPANLISGSIESFAGSVTAGQASGSKTATVVVWSLHSTLSEQAAQPH